MTCIGCMDTSKGIYYSLMQMAVLHLLNIGDIEACVGLAHNVHPTAILACYGIRELGGHHVVGAVEVEVVGQLKGR